MFYYVHEIINQAIQNYSFIIFNRYGQKIFETREYGKGWDGSLKGKPQPSGPYVYHIKFTNIFGVETVAFRFVGSKMEVIEYFSNFTAIDTNICC